MKELAQQAAMDGDDKEASKIAVIGSIGLYLTCSTCSSSS